MQLGPRGGRVHRPRPRRPRPGVSVAQRRGGGQRARLGVDDGEDGRGALDDGGHLRRTHARVDARGDGAQAQEGGVEHGVVDGGGQEQADHVALAHPVAGQQSGHAVGRTVPGAEGQAAAGGPGHGRLDERLDVAIDVGGLTEDGDDGAVPVQGDLLRHGGRRWYQGLAGRRPSEGDRQLLLCSPRVGRPVRRRRCRPDALGSRARHRPGDITAVVNVGDDMVLHGLHISPDIDTVTYTLAGLDNRKQAGASTGETWTVLARAVEHSAGRTGSRLGDRDLATHLFRTGRLAAGEPLGAVTASWRPGVASRSASCPSPTMRCAPGSPWPRRARWARPGPRSASRTTSSGCTTTSRSRGVRFEGARRRATRTRGPRGAGGRRAPSCVCPSNPVVSIGPLLAVPGVRAAVDGSARACRGRLAHRGRVGAQGSGRPTHGRTRHGVHRRRGSPPLRPVGGHAGHRRGRRGRGGPGRGGGHALRRDRDRDAARPETAAALARTCARCRPLRASARHPRVRASARCSRGPTWPGSSQRLRRVGPRCCARRRGRGHPEDRVEGRGTPGPGRPRRPGGQAGAGGAGVRAHCAPAGRLGHQRDHRTGSSAPTPASTCPTWTRARRPCCPRIRPLGPPHPGRPEAMLGVDVGVIVSDTFGRPWRRGVTDVAIGCAGVAAVVDLRGTLETPGAASWWPPRSASPTRSPRPPSW